MTELPFSDDQIEAIRFSDDQISTLVLAVISGTPGINREKIFEFVEWCGWVRANAAIVDLILDRRLHVVYTSPGVFGLIVVGCDMEGDDQ